MNWMAERWLKSRQLSHNLLFYIEKQYSSTDKDELTDGTVAPGTGGTGGKTGQLAQLDSLLARLPQLSNRDLIDAAAVEFCYLNSKASRKKLAKVYGVETI